MTRQLSVATYVTQFQGALSTLMTPTPVYSTYNVNYANQGEFCVWYMRNIAQDVYTGAQGNKGIDHPVFQVNVFAKSLSRSSALCDVIIQAWHGYTGNLNGISAGKITVEFLLNTYDEEASLHQSVLDISMQVAVPTA